MEFRDFFQRATNQKPFPYQERLALADPLPDMLSVPTGAGKTAAAVLAWLWRRRFAPEAVRAMTPRRLVFCLPMRVLVEQTARSIEGWLAALELEAEVGLHVLMGGAVDDVWHRHPARDAVLVGTQDQLLSRALNRGYGMSRFLWPVHFAWLSNDCLWILDETQLMGPGLSTSAQLQGLRDKLGAWNVRSLWMSATLDPARLATVDFRARPLVRLELESSDRAAPELRPRLEASKPLALARSSFVKKGLEALASEVIEAHRSKTRTLVVLNTVGRAQDLAQALRRKAKQVKVALLHSRFRPADRRSIEAEALAKNFDGILVSTQAVEAGVDISAATLFTELASWSALVQRFGRCNRYGEFDEAQVAVRWIDVPAEESMPYAAEELRFARSRLVELSEVGPSALSRLEEPVSGPVLPVIRRRDLLDLFDTTPDLSGHDLDVSPYVRDADDGAEVQVAWRVWEGEEPPAALPALHRDELCRVRAGDLKKERPSWRWSTLDGRWEKVREGAVPGNVYLARSSDGGYDPLLGWTGAVGASVPVVEVPALVNAESDDADPDVEIGEYVSLTTHSDDTAREMSKLLARDLPGAGEHREALLRAARWHDLGKVHRVFQAALIARLEEGDPRRSSGPWAKSATGRGGRYERRHFRHELASALAALELGESDLVCYLVAAHHGKVRSTIRSRPGERPEADERIALGVVEGDELPGADLGGGTITPPVTLSLDVMEVGEAQGRPTWSTRVAGLLESLGPHRLAYLEALVRAADWAASRAPSGSGEDRHV